MITRATLSFKLATSYLKSKEDYLYLGRTLTAIAVAPVLKLTSYRFSKAFRHEETKAHAIVYACINTVVANLVAGMEGI